MTDLIFVALTLAFFALCTGYVSWCDRMIGPDPVESGDTAAESRS